MSLDKLVIAVWTQPVSLDKVVTAVWTQPVSLHKVVTAVWTQPVPLHKVVTAVWTQPVSLQTETFEFYCARKEIPLKFAVFQALKIRLFWDLPCAERFFSLLRFGGTFCLPLQYQPH